jgi:hypothetical protein
MPTTKHIKKTPEIDKTLAIGVNDSGPTNVSVVGYSYRVEWLMGVSPQFHHVGKNKICQCVLGSKCPSIQRVRDYLDDGGERAPDYPEDYWPVAPRECPICGKPCEEYEFLDFHPHGMGWKCSIGGSLHYWEARLNPIIKAHKGYVASNNSQMVIESHTRWEKEGYRPWD